MSGHSKWSTIKRKKDITDKARGVVFSKLSRIITASVVEGGGVADPAGNVRLASAIQRAREANMPKDNIERAIEKASSASSSNIKEIICEGFGSNGLMFIITATTDNPNRTLPVIKNSFEKLGGKWGNENSVKYQFTKCGVVEFDKNNVTEEGVYDFADKIGASDIEDDESYYVYVPFEKVGTVNQFLGDMHVKGIDIIYRPNAPIQLESNIVEKAHLICEALEDLDDVDGVYTNMAI